MIGTPAQLVMRLMKAPQDKLFELKEHRKKRTLTQNAYYWQLIGKLAPKLGMNNNELHNRLLQSYGKVELFGGKALRAMLPDTDETEKEVLNNQTVHLKPTSQTTVLADGVRYRTYVLMKGSHDMNTKEMAELLDGCVMECKQHDIETLPPWELAEMRRMEDARKNKGNADSKSSEGEGLPA